MSTPNPLLAHLLATPPFIPELHRDDCDDVDCTRCAPTPAIARLDVPLDRLAADVAALAERQQRLAKGIAAEQRHLLHDADPDSTIPPFVDLAKGRRGVQS